MSTPHVIRLRGPWNLEPQSGAGAPPARRLHLPDQWREAFAEGFAGPVSCRRVFHEPTNLGPHDPLWLVVRGAACVRALCLNGLRLWAAAAPAAELRHEIRGVLRPENELELLVDWAAAGGDCPAGEVLLEIHESST
jgi:hypothetical protein